MSIGIGKRLQAKRIAMGLTSAAEASRRFGWVESTYRAHENEGITPKHDDLISYAAAYHCSVAYLLTGVETTGEGFVVPIVDMSQLPKERGRMMGAQQMRAIAEANITFRRSVGNKVICIAAPDDSMIDAANARLSIHAGDDVVIDYSADLKPGQIALIYDASGDEHVLRRAEFKSRTVVRFVPANSAFPSFELPSDSKAIIGVVTALQRVF
jgi:transcriptional regulator with XRE-family HTH domain